MKIPYRYRPGAGFILLIVVSIMMGGFFAWGFSQPEMDRVWFLKQRTEQHAIVLDDGEFAFLDEAMRRHGVLAEDVLDGNGAELIEPTVEGWTTAQITHLVIAPVGTEGIEIEVQCKGAVLHPLTVTFTANNLHETLDFEEDGILTFVVRPEMTTVGKDQPFMARVMVDGEFETESDDLVGLRITAEAP